MQFDGCNITARQRTAETTRQSLLLDICHRCGRHRSQQRQRLPLVNPCLAHCTHSCRQRRHDKWRPKHRGSVIHRFFRAIDRKWPATDPANQRKQPPARPVIFCFHGKARSTKLHRTASREAHHGMHRAGTCAGPFRCTQHAAVQRATGMHDDAPTKIGPGVHQPCARFFNGGIRHA